MSILRVLEIFLPIVYVINVTWALKHDSNVLHLLRKRQVIDRGTLSEYLLPPPLPHDFAPARSPKTINVKRTESINRLTRYMNWLNSQSSTTSKSVTIFPTQQPAFFSPVTYRSHTFHTRITPYPLYPMHHPTTSLYNSVTPPPSSFWRPPSTRSDRQVISNLQRNHLPTNKGINCNICNKIPWIPLKSGNHFPREPSYASTHLQTQSTNEIMVTYNSHQATRQADKIPEGSQLLIQQANLPKPNPISISQLHTSMPSFHTRKEFGLSVKVSDQGNIHLQPLSDYNNVEFYSNAPYPKEYIYTANSSYLQHQHGVSNNEDLTASGTQMNRGNVNTNTLHKSPAKDSREISTNEVTHRFPGNSHLTGDTRTEPHIKNSIHFEESPVLDFTNDNNHINAAGVPTTEILISQTYRALHDPTEASESDYTGINDDILQNNLDATELLKTYLPTPNLQIENRHLNYSQSDNQSNTSYTILKNLKADKQEDSYVSSSAQLGYLWSTILPHTIIHNGETASTENRSATDTELEGHPLLKKHKEVQVIIPYTSEYTPLSFRPSLKHWDVEDDDAGLFPKTEPRNLFENETATLAGVTRSSSNKANNKTKSSIDINRLQKNIDNWTIQEYSRVTTSSTPLLVKKIPDEYLTTTESEHHGSTVVLSNSNVKTYSLTGFTFQKINRGDEQVTKTHPDDEKHLTTVTVISQQNASSNNQSTYYEPTTETGTSSLTSTTERIFVVTPVPLPALVLSKIKRNKIEKNEGSLNKELDRTSKERKFEAIERAYQVLPQAVNNLAAASTGREVLPLWGIMELEDFALSSFEYANQVSEHTTERPILYSGHSKVSHAQR